MLMPHDIDRANHYSIPKVPPSKNYIMFESRFTDLRTHYPSKMCATMKNMHLLLGRLGARCGLGTSVAI